MNSKSSLPFIDAHCHLTDPALFEKIEKVIQASWEAGVGGWVQGGTDPTEWKRQKEINNRWGSDFVMSFGMHPWWISKQTPEKVSEALKDLDDQLPEASFLGELGLDFGEKYLSSKKLQLESLEAQLEINQKHRKPLVLHVVKAHSEVMVTLKRFTPQRGLVHAFSESKEVLKSYLDFGFYISVGGALLRPGYKKLKEAVSYIPQERLLIETDTLGPAHLVEVAKEAAKYFPGKTPQEILLLSKENLIALKDAG